jgi:hypothetical protein
MAAEPASNYERLEIDALLRGGSPPLARRRGGGLVLLPESDFFADLCGAAILPALHDNGLNQRPTVHVFDSDTFLDTVHAELTAADVIVADVTGRNPDLLYVLGLCHGIGRCPLLIAQRPAELPFGLGALRHVGYAATAEGVRRLREDLSRALRVFLAASRARPSDPREDEPEA